MRRDRSGWVAAVAVAGAVVTGLLTGAAGQAAKLELAQNSATEGADAKSPFSAMSVGEVDAEECKSPRPPRDLAPSAYIRNGHVAIRRIMAAEQWQETKSCECIVSDISWEDVVKEAENYVTSDSSRLPFDVVALNEQADELEAKRTEACTE